MIPLKETNKAPVTDHKEEFYELSDKELGIILLRKVSELPEKRQITQEIKKTIHKQSE